MTLCQLKQHCVVLLQLAEGQVHAPRAAWQTGVAAVLENAAMFHQLAPVIRVLAARNPVAR